jgi:hypothetical protein
MHGQRYPRIAAIDDDAPAPLPIARYRDRGESDRCDAIARAERALDDVQAKLSELDRLADEARRADAIPFRRATWRTTDDDGPWAA